MKVLVTGGSGRAGKYVIKELLDNGHSVVNADMINGYLEDRNPELNFKKIDFTDYGQTIFAADQCDAIIHLAAIPNPGVIPNQEVFRVNMLSTFNILEAAEEKGIEKIVLASSVNASLYSQCSKGVSDFFDLFNIELRKIMFFNFIFPIVWEHLSVLFIIIT